MHVIVGELAAFPSNYGIPSDKAQVAGVCTSYAYDVLRSQVRRRSADCSVR